MYERFTDRAKEVMRRANQEAIRNDCAWVTAAHILCGMLLEGGITGNGVAGSVLRGLGLTLKDIRRFIPQQPEEAQVFHKLPHDESARKLTEDAIAEARALQHNYVGTEHLLLGLLRQSDGVAIAALRSIGLISNDKIRREVLHVLGINRTAKSFRDEVAALIVKHKGSSSAESALINCIAACITAVDAAGEK